jgi:hypothetical protein
MMPVTTNCQIILLWWLMNFGMPDLFDKIVNFPPILCTMLAAKELLRNKKVYGAVGKALSAYDKNFPLAVLVGMCGACGGGFINHGLACMGVKSISAADHNPST